MFSRRTIQRLLLLFLLLALLAVPVFALTADGPGPASDNYSTGLEVQNTGGSWAFPYGDCNGGSGGSCGGG